MRDGGKGDKQRPLSVPMEQFDNNWDAIFKKTTNDYQDVLSTEDCFLDALEKLQKNESNSDSDEKKL